MENVNKYSYNQTNAVALAGAELKTRQGNVYRVFVGWHDVGNPNFPASLVWVPFKIRTAPWGEDGERVPCFTDAEERRFPKALAKLGHELVISLRAQQAPPKPSEPTLF